MPLRARHSRNLPAPVKRTRPGDSKAHLAFVRSLPCCVCGCHWFIDAHHLMRAVDNLPKGAGRKNEDRWTVPLCKEHHLATYGPDTAHGYGNDEEWLASKGIQGADLASALWRITTTKEPGERLILGLRAVERAKRVVNAGNGT